MRITLKNGSWQRRMMINPLTPGTKNCQKMQSRLRNVPAGMVQGPWEYGECKIDQIATLLRLCHLALLRLQVARIA